MSRRSRWRPVVFVCGALVLLMLHSVYAAATLNDEGNVRVTTRDFFPGAPPSGDGFGAAAAPFDVFQQNEPSIAQHPIRSNLLAVGANDVRTFGLSGDAWQSLAYSTNSGSTWPEPNQSLIPGFPGDTSADGLVSPVRGNRAASDPWLSFDLQGNLFFAFIAFQRAFPHDPGTRQDQANAIAVAKYTVEGPVGTETIKYLKTVIVERGTMGFGRQEDKEGLAVDNSVTSPSEGNVYVCWSRFTGAFDHLMLARSTDQGETYSKAIKLDESTPAIQGCNIAVRPNGDVYVVYRKFALAPPFTPQTRGIFGVRSTDGGRTFSRPVRISGFVDFAQTATRTPPIFRTFVLPAVAADATAVYVAWATRSATTGADIQISCSTNGVSWTLPVRPHRVVPDGHQIMPALAAAGGKVSALWYDSRSEPTFTPAGPVSGDNVGTGRGMEVFYNQATSACPLAFTQSEELAVTSQSFNPNLFASILAITPFIGDYIAIAADGSKAYAIWGDNRDINPTQNALEDGVPGTNPQALINARSRDANIYFQRINK